MKIEFLHHVLGGIRLCGPCLWLIRENIYEGLNLSLYVRMTAAHEEDDWR